VSLAVTGATTSADIGQAVADSSGDWSITTSAFAEGANNITASQTDIAGNMSAAPAPLAVTIDTTPPPTVDAFADDTGAPDRVTGDQTLVFSGTTLANRPVDVFLDGALFGMAMADGAGDGSFDNTGSPLADSATDTTLYQITGGAGGGAGAAVSVTVEGPTDAPAAEDDSGANDGEGPFILIGVLADDTDPHHAAAQPRRYRRRDLRVGRGRGGPWRGAGRPVPRHVFEAGLERMIDPEGDAYCVACLASGALSRGGVGFEVSDGVEARALYRDIGETGLLIADPDALIV